MQVMIKWGVRIAVSMSIASLLSIPFGYISPAYQTVLDSIMIVVWIHMEWEVFCKKRAGA